MCEFTVRCKHLTLWDLQLSPADLTPMEAPQVVEICYRCTTCSILWWAAILFVDRKRCTTFCLCELKLAKENEVILCCVLWGCDHQCRILDAVCCVLCAVCCVLCAVCEFTVRCKHLTLWDLQLSPADLTPMESTTSCGNMLQVYHLQHIVMSSRCTTCCYAAILFVDRKRCTTFCLCELKLANEKKISRTTIYT